MTCQQHTRALLDISTALLAMQREIITLRAQVEAMRASKPSPWITLERIATLIRWIGRFLETPSGQSLTAAAIGAGAWLVKWLVGNS